MLTNNDIAAAIAALVAEKFPGEPVYRGYVPTGFARPSTLLEQSGGKLLPSFGCGTVELRPQFTLTAFVETDAYHQGDGAELCRRQMALLGLFLPGYIRIGDRAPRVLDGGELANGLDFAAVTVTLAYTLGRQDFMELEQRPGMAALHLNQEVIAHG